GRIRYQHAVQAFEEYQPRVREACFRLSGQRTHTTLLASFTYGRRILRRVRSGEDWSAWCRSSIHCQLRSQHPWRGDRISLRSKIQAHGSREGGAISASRGNTEGRTRIPSSK